MNSRFATEAASQLAAHPSALDALLELLERMESNLEKVRRLRTDTPAMQRVLAAPGSRKLLSFVGFAAEGGNAGALVLEGATTPFMRAHVAAAVAALRTSRQSDATYWAAAADEAEAAQAAQAAAASKARHLAATPPEPEVGAAGTTTLRFILPDGPPVTRRFYADHTFGQVQSYMRALLPESRGRAVNVTDVVSACDESHNLGDAQAQRTLQALGLWPSARLACLPGDASAPPPDAAATLKRPLPAAPAAGKSSRKPKPSEIFKQMRGRFEPQGAVAAAPREHFNVQRKQSKYKPLSQLLQVK